MTINLCLWSQLRTTVSIRIVADCVALSCQVTRKLKRATTLEFTTISAIIFIHCYRQFLLSQLLISSKENSINLSFSVIGFLGSVLIL